VRQPIEYFTPILSEPLDYSQALPNFCNAYICASIAKLARKESVIAAHTNDEYKKAVRKTLAQWGLDGAEKTVFINSREIPNGRPGTQGLILFHDGTAFIVFRSTERKLSDWMTNFNSRLTDCPYVEGKVHTGFLEAFKAIVIEEGDFLSVFEQEIDKLRDASAIWITGHSLGGALASIAASYLLHSNIRVSGIYTFGAPRVGNEKYRDYLNARLTYKYWRFMHKSDVVPDVPLPLSRFDWLPHLVVSGYSREGCMLRLTDTGDYYEVLRRVERDGARIRLGRYDGLTWADHSVDFYRDRLFNLCHKDNPDFPKMTYQGVSPEIELETTPKDIEEIERRARS
jgi:hypothetical protein